MPLAAWRNCVGAVQFRGYEISWGEVSWGLWCEHCFRELVINVLQGASRQDELPRQPQPDLPDKWSLLRQPSISVPPLDDIVTKILNDDSTDVEPPMAAVIGRDTGDVMLHPDQWDHAELSDISAKSQSCTSDVFSFDGYVCTIALFLSVLLLSWLVINSFCTIP